MQNIQPWEIGVDSVAAICDAWAIDQKAAPGNRNDRKGLVFVSLAAPASTIKGIRAKIRATNRTLAQLTPLFVDEDGESPPPIRRIDLSPLRKGQQFQRRLTGLTHQHHYLAMVGDSAQYSPDEDDSDEEANVDRFYVVAQRPEDGPLTFYRQFIRRSPTPTLPQWAQYIWDEAEDRNQITQLAAYGITAWRCEVNYQELEKGIVTALRRGRLATG